ncbi:hypothetical protein [Streptomyces sp. NPDC002402]
MTTAKSPCCPARCGLTILGTRLSLGWRQEALVLGAMARPH